VVSLHLVVAEANTCAPWGGACPRTFFLFFFVVKRVLRGVPNARRICYSFCVMRLLSLSSIARVKRGAESALERSEELQKEFKKGLFFWKCSIFARCLNRVGCEF
jgi:hypothetical protein